VFGIREILPGKARSCMQDGTDGTRTLGWMNTGGWVWWMGVVDGCCASILGSLFFIGG
jgi:hypothetical protein